MFSLFHRRATSPVSADVPDPEIRDFLRERADEVGLDLPPLGHTPRRWWTPWRAPAGTTPDLPADNGAFLTFFLRRRTGILILAIVLRTINFTINALIPWAMGRLIDIGLRSGFGPQLVAPSTTFLALIVVAAIANGSTQMTDNSLWMSASMGSVRGVGGKLSRSGRAVKKKMPAGDVVTALMTDADYFGGAFGWTPEIFGSVISTAVVVILMFRASLPLGLIIIIGLPLVILGTTLLVKPLQAKQAVAREEQGVLTTISTDAVSGLRVLRGIGGEDVYNATYQAQSARVRDAGIRVASTSAMLNMLRNSMPLVFTAVIVGIGAVLAFDGAITVGQLVAFYGYTSFLRTPISVAVNVIQQYTRAWVGVKKMTRVLAIEPLTDDSHVTSDAADRSVHETEAPAPATSSCLDWTRATLEDPISGVIVRPGRVTALVSADPDITAAIARRLGRVDDRDEMFVDGRDARTIPLDEVRRSVVLSEAEFQIFAGSLREEVEGAEAPVHRSRGVTELIQRELIEASTRREDILFRPDPDRDDTRWEDALHVADAHDVVSSLPGRLDGAIAEKGRNLSGGQRQRVALARAVAADSPILIAVEPTSAVDSHTEARIAERLAYARQGRTTVLVTASPLVLERCDEVVVVSTDGHEVVRGSHEELRAAAETGDTGAVEYRSIVSRKVGEPE